MAPILVASASDERLADYVGLRDADLRRGGEHFVCEGRLVLQRAAALRWPLRSVLLAEGREQALADVLHQLDPATPVYLAPAAVLAQVVGFDLHRGIVASARRPVARRAADLVRGARTVAVLEGVNDAENLGALYRNAVAFGVDAVLLDPTTADPWNRRTVRVSLGHVMAVPTARVEPWPAGLDELRHAGLTVVALTPGAGAAPVSVLEGMGPIALLLGAEGPGLSAAALAAADVRVRVPMVAGVDSLNVATAAAIAFHRRTT
jgi:tRNA G18 (ribose-2'-O)-methylase SpoU